MLSLQVASLQLERNESLLLSELSSIHTRKTLSRQFTFLALDVFENCFVKFLFQSNSWLLSYLLPVSLCPLMSSDKHPETASGALGPKRRHWDDLTEILAKALRFGRDFLPRRSFGFASCRHHH